MLHLAALLLAALLPQPQLIDQTGKHFAFDSLRGTPLVVAFVAAHCTDACPLVNAQFAQAAQQLRARHAKVRMLTVTLDPEHDSPVVMRDLARRFDADPRAWLFASGSIAGVHRVMNAFGVIARLGPHGYAETHSTFVYLVDARGRVRERLLASTALASDIVERER